MPSKFLWEDKFGSLAFLVMMCRKQWTRERPRSTGRQGGVQQAAHTRGSFILDHWGAGGILHGTLLPYKGRPRVWQGFYHLW